MNRRDHKKFMSRTRNAFASHRRRALESKEELDYTLDHIRQHIAWHLTKPCPYCKLPITIRNFSVDHRIPIARGGSFAWENLEVIDTRCNQIKGTMTAGEYVTFLEQLSILPEPVTKNIMARMRAGAAIIRC